MFFFACIILTVCGAAAAVALYVRTPDADRRRAYPDEPERWRGATGDPASLGHALGAPLFYAMGAASFGGLGAVCSWLGLEAPGSLGGPEARPAGLMPGLGPASLALAFAGAAAWTCAAARRILRAGPGAMRAWAAASKAPVGERPRVLFVCGSPNQTTQMHQIARALPGVEAWFTPYYSDHWGYRFLMKLGLLESTILGHRRRGICLDYLNAKRLPVDLCGERNDYDAFVSCNDQVIAPGLQGTPWVLVQEGIQEPSNWRTRLWRRFRFIPVPLTGTATFGLSNRYDFFCVASEGYRRRYRNEGIAADKLVVTGIPNFDDFARFRRNSFPHRGYVLVCTSDARETWLAADRRAILAQAVAVAAGRPLVFKLHPNEEVDRATREIRAAAPEALVFSKGSAEEMVANCAVLITEWSSVTFCGVALGKEVHSLHSLDEVRELLPLQHGRAAEEIARVVADLLARSGRAPAPERPTSLLQENRP